MVSGASSPMAAERLYAVLQVSGLPKGYSRAAAAGELAAVAAELLPGARVTIDGGGRLFLYGKERKGDRAAQAVLALQFGPGRAYRVSVAPSARAPGYGITGERPSTGEEIGR